MKLTIKLIIFLCLIVSSDGFSDLYLKDNLQRAQPGDYIVTAQNKTYTVLHIFAKENQNLIIEEITVPVTQIQSDPFSWKNWVENNAPGHTSWVIYKLDLNNAEMDQYFSFTKNSWFEMHRADNFLSTLLNLKLAKIPKGELKKIGPSPMSGFPDMRKPWQPKMVLDGRVVDGVKFAAYRTQWPEDGTELSNKTIEVYVPEENERYPSYFPYWLQISGMVGKAKVRIIDSGTGMISPKPGFPLRGNS